MRFVYQFRTSDNVLHRGVVEAANREAAFRLLKAQGIRPGKLEEAPGFFNKLFGRGKRWLAIAVLAMSLVAIVVALLRAENAERYACEERAQLFGDPSVLQKLSRNGWRGTFDDIGEAWLARHAIPGKVCDCPAVGEASCEIAAALLARAERPLAIAAADGDELSKMKRIVNGMKREFAAYAENERDALDYMAKACERCRIEKGVYENVARELDSLQTRMESDAKVDQTAAREAWDKKNTALRAMGLPTVPQPE